MHHLKLAHLRMTPNILSKVIVSIHVPWQNDTHAAWETFPQGAFMVNYLYVLWYMYFLSTYFLYRKNKVTKNWRVKKRQQIFRKK